MKKWRTILEPVFVILTGTIFLFGLFQSEKLTGKTISTLEWPTLQELDFQTGKASSNLRKVDGKTVRIAGYAVPLEGSSWDSISSFLLVPDALACIHVPPPPPNQMVHVKMFSEISVENIYGPIQVTGSLKIVNTESQYGTASFEMAGVNVEPFIDEDEDPLSKFGY